MFDATIAENIAFGTEQPDLEQVMWAARVANAAEFIERQSLGYETRIDESGLLLQTTTGQFLMAPDTPRGIVSR